MEFGTSCSWPKYPTEEQLQKALLLLSRYEDLMVRSCNMPNHICEIPNPVILDEYEEGETWTCPICRITWVWTIEQLGNKPIGYWRIK